MEFCPKCKSMMFPIEGSLKCKKCGYEKDKETNPELVSRSNREEREVTVLEGDIDEGLPTTTARCPECENNVAYWWLRQLRSADESETRFFKCTKCSFTWREYD
ncbi:DNA-directed RNA polymerase subunit M [Methanococcoides methylutens]|uniref:Transcription factor S n=1 Tax=Methanococcoides methylutens TaxID=2226 RepID=A0A099T294_METMT|nr:transcription factor S [Methanococcoides methylutens]KGK99295.1 DNA-directed RNA polymerase subunit M [Methanococcoides methylutens]